MADAPARNIFYVPPGVPFLPALIQGLHERFPEYHDAMDQITVWLPNKKLCKEFVGSFSDFTGNEVDILPNIQALGDLNIEHLTDIASDDFIPDLAGKPLSQDDRLLHLISLIRMADNLPAAWQHLQYLSFAQLASFAQHILQFYDEMIREDIPPDCFAHVVPSEVADHFHNSIAFFKWLYSCWPKYLAENGYRDLLCYRNTILHNMVNVMECELLSDPLVIAGSTGTNAAVRTLLSAVAEQDKGAVVLPAFQPYEGERLRETHPYYQYEKLFEQNGLAGIQEASLWARETNKRACSDISLLWLNLHAPHKDGLQKEYTDDITVVAAAHEVEEAKVIALLLREAYEKKVHTALCIEDRTLLRYVLAELQSYNIRPSIQLALDLCDHPRFLLWNELIRYLFASEKGSLWRMMQMLIRASRNDELQIAFNRLASIITKEELWNNEEGWLAICVDYDIPLQPLISCLIMARKGIKARDSYDNYLRTIIESLEALGNILSLNTDAETLSIIMECSDRDDILLEKASTFEWLSYLLEHKQFLPEDANVNFMEIVSPLEARLVEYDQVIFAACNEGCWPSYQQDSFFNDAMRKVVGLPAKGAATGKSAFDVLSLLTTKKVVFTYAHKRNGVAVLPSPWLLTMAGLLSCDQQYQQFLSSGNNWLSLVRQRERVAKSRIYHNELKVKRQEGLTFPKTLSISAIELMSKNPYGFYSKYILGLKPREHDKKNYRQTKGLLFHKALELWFMQHESDTASPEASFISLFDDFLADCDLPLVEKTSLSYEAEWLEGWLENYFKQEILPSRIVIEASLSASFRNSRYKLYGRLDRLDFYDEGRSVVVLDYKTGQRPAKKAVYFGLAPQLPLQALLCRSNYKVALKDLVYWDLTGKKQAVKSVKFASKRVNIEELIDYAEEGLVALLRYYEKDSAVFLSCPHPHYKGYNPYEDLSRDKEWRYG